MPESCEDAAVCGFGDDTLILICKVDVSDLLVADFGHTKDILGVLLDLGGVCGACCFHLQLDLYALELLKLCLSGFNFLRELSNVVSTVVSSTVSVSTAGSVTASAVSGAAVSSGTAVS